MEFPLGVLAAGIGADLVLSGGFFSVAAAAWKAMREDIGLSLLCRV